MVSTSLDFENLKHVSQCVIGVAVASLVCFIVAQILQIYVHSNANGKGAIVNYFLNNCLGIAGSLQ